MAKPSSMTKRAVRRKRSGISSFSVCGYKSIADEQTIELRPLTLLAGANSSGKSSMLQPLLLMKQTLEAPFDPGALLLDGHNVSFSSAEQLISKNKSSCGDGFSVKIGRHDGDSLEFIFKRVPSVGVDIDVIVVNESGIAKKIFPKMASDDVIKYLPSFFGNDDNLKTRKWTVIRDRFLFNYGFEDAESKAVYRVLDVTPLASEVKSDIQNLIHVPGLRGNPKRTYPATAVGHTFPGGFENYVASIIHHWKLEKNLNLNELGKSLETLGLTWKVDAKPVDDTRVELKVGRLPHSKRGGAHDLVSVADVGFGLSQTLPVLVALLVARPGQIVYLEQPEIHLHPRAQKQMAIVMAQAAKRGVIVVAETHSSLLLLGIQTLVAKGELSPELVKLHWFQRDEAGATKVSSADLDNKGAFGGWPEDFDDVSLEAAKEYLDAVEFSGSPS